MRSPSNFDSFFVFGGTLDKKRLNFLPELSIYNGYFLEEVGYTVVESQEFLEGFNLIYTINFLERKTHQFRVIFFLFV